MRIGFSKRVNLAFNAAFNVMMVVAVLVGGGLLPVAAQAAACDSETDYTVEADAAFAAEEYAAAADLYLCTMPDSRFDGQAMLNWMESLIREGRYTEMVVPQLYLLSTDPTINAGRERIAERIASLEDQLDEPLDETDLETAIVLMILYNITQPDQDIVEGSVQHVLDLDPDSAIGHFYNGYALINAGDFDAATMEFEQAHALAPDDPDILGAVGNEWSIEGKVEEAEELLNRAIELAPTVGGLYGYQADNLNFGRGDYERAIELSLQAGELSPYDYTIFINRAYARISGDLGLDTALAEAQHAVELNPSSPGANRTVVDVQIARGDMDGAGEAVLQLLSLRSDQPVRDALEAGTPVTVPMAFGRVYHFPVTLESGQTVSFREDSVVEGTVDSYLVLMDPEGKAVAFHDDVDYENGDTNALIGDYVVEMSGDYTLLVTHAGAGYTGEVEVEYTISTD